MSSSSRSFSKSLRNIRRQFEKRNGKANTKTSALIISGTELISRHIYDASLSPETFAFLTDLVENDLPDRAKNLIDLFIDLYPQLVSKNPKFGETLRALAKSEEQEYVATTINKLIFGKIDNGPSLPSMATELAENESVLLALKELAEQSSGAQAALMIHRLAIMAPKELARNPKLRKTLDELSDIGFDTEVQFCIEVLETQGSGLQL